MSFNIKGRNPIHVMRPRVKKFLVNAIARKSQLPFGLAPLHATSDGTYKQLRFAYHWDFQFFTRDLDAGVVTTHMQPEFPVWCQHVSVNALYTAFLWQYHGQDFYYKAIQEHQLTIGVFGLALQQVSEELRCPIERVTRRRGTRYDENRNIVQSVKRSFYKFRPLETL